MKTVLCILGILILVLLLVACFLMVYIAAVILHYDCENDWPTHTHHENDHLV